jgi:hypothetical protein
MERLLPLLLGRDWHEENDRTKIGWAKVPRLIEVDKLEPNICLISQHRWYTLEHSWAALLMIRAS